MSLFSRLFGKQPQVGHVGGPATFEFDVVGESHYQRNLEKLNGGRDEEGARTTANALLIPEDDNRHDKQAVRVDIDGLTVGYLSRSDARALRRRIKEAGLTDLIISCNAIIVGGWDRGPDDRGHFGVKLDLPTE